MFFHAMQFNYLPEACALQNDMVTNYDHPAIYICTYHQLYALFWMSSHFMQSLRNSKVKFHASRLLGLYTLVGGIVESY